MTQAEICELLLASQLSASVPLDVATDRVAAGFYVERPEGSIWDAEGDRHGT